jgi:hypothetical protein
LYGPGPKVKLAIRTKAKKQITLDAVSEFEKGAAAILAVKEAEWTMRQ